MLMTARKTVTQCWVDVFERPHFQGRMRRLVGPGDFSPLVTERGKWTPASMIVGPDSAVVCQWQPPSTRDPRWLRPKGLIPNISQLLAGGTLQSIRILPENSADQH